MKLMDILNEFPFTFTQQSTVQVINNFYVRRRTLSSAVSVSCFII